MKSTNRMPRPLLARPAPAAGRIAASHPASQAEWPCAEELAEVDLYLGWLMLNLNHRLDDDCDDPTLLLQA